MEGTESEYDRNSLYTCIKFSKNENTVVKDSC